MKNNIFKKGESYFIDLHIEAGDIKIFPDLYGKVQVECFEKNFGTFEEDSSWINNIDLDELIISNKPFSSYPKNSFTQIDIKPIKEEIIEIAKNALNKHLYGDI